MEKNQQLRKVGSILVPKYSYVLKKVSLNLIFVMNYILSRILVNGSRIRAFWE